MSLLALQSAFRDEIVADDAGIAPSSPGMEIYRNAYRGRLLGALEASFERTRRWAGEAAFTAAACHYILTHAPSSWTLDDFGEGFPELLRELFAEDREVAELAWLEWHMQRAFAAPDLPELDPAALASAGLAAGDWDHLGFSMAAGFAARPIATNCAALWLAMAEETDGEFAPEPTDGTCLAVWRRGLEPHFRVLDTDEHRALAGLACGESLGGIAAGVEPEVLGNWLALWLSEGMFSAFRMQAP